MMPSLLGAWTVFHTIGTISEVGRYVTGFEPGHTV